MYLPGGGQMGGSKSPSFQCFSDGKNYLTECQLKTAQCELQQELSKKFSGACGEILEKKIKKISKNYILHFNPNPYGCLKLPNPYVGGAIWPPLLFSTYNRVKCSFIAQMKALGE